MSSADGVLEIRVVHKVRGVCAVRGSGRDEIFEHGECMILSVFGLRWCWGEWVGGLGRIL